MLDSQLEKTVIKLYKDVGEIIDSKRVKEGYLSNNQIIRNKSQKFFLKQYNQEHTIEKIEEIFKVSEFFYSNNIPIVLPIINNLKQLYFQFNSNIYALFPFIESQSVSRNNIKKENIISLAETLAKMHLLSSKGIPIQINSYQKTANREKFLNTYAEIMDVLESKKQLNTFDKLALKNLKHKKLLVEKSSEIENQSISTYFNHLLHGDYHEKNVFFDKLGNVEYIFDLDMTKIGNRLSELIRSMDFICLNTDYESTENLEKAKLYIHTYKKIYPFKKKDFEIALREYSIKKAHSLWIESTHYLNHSSRVDHFLENEIRILNYFPKNSETFIKKLEI